MTFSEEVVVTGTPRVELDLGSRTRLADYESVDGRLVTFGYTVAEGDSATNGIAVAANKLTLNGGSIKDAADNNANLSHTAIARQSGHRVDGIRPRLQRLEIASSSWNANDVFGPDAEVIVFAEFSEKVFASNFGPDALDFTKGPAPQLKLDFDGVEKVATWRSNYAIGAYFSYWIQEGDSDLDGIKIAANSVDLNTGYFRDGAGNHVSDLTHSAIGASYGNRVDALAPTISSIAITSDPGADDTYGTGDQVEVTVTFSENVTVSSSVSRQPQLELDIGGEAKTADYQRHKGPAVVFAYNVQAGDSDEDGISISANKLLVRNRGRIVDTMGSFNSADLSHDAVAADPNHKVAGPSSSFTLWENNASLRYDESRASTQTISIYI